MYRKYPYTNFHDINLDWIIKRVQDLEEKVKSVEDLSSQWESTLEEIKQDIIQMQNLYDAIVRDNASFKDEVTNNFSALSSDINAQINALSDDINRQFINYTNSINDKISALEYNVNFNLTAFNRQLTNMDRKLEYAINNLWLNLKMINPFTGQEESVLSVIDFLSSLHMTDGITAIDYDTLELTAQVYDDKQLTAQQYDAQANILLRN